MNQSLETIKQVARPTPRQADGEFASDTMAVFLEAESATADADIVHPRGKATGYYTPINALKSNGAKVVRGSFFTVAALFLSPSIAFADGVEDILDNLIELVGDIIPVLIGCAVVVFFWGLVKFIAHADDEKAVTEGKQFMIWGLIGIFVIVALWSIVGFIQTQLGLDVSSGLEAPTLPTDIP
ncbi:MAG: pilin [bacterium]|nr:pilin [bacterium]